MNRICKAFLLFAAMWLASALTLAAQDRWALVLGVSDYQSDQIEALENTVNDARTMAGALNNMGFDVYYLENATKAEIEATVSQIETERKDTELGLFYFAGHGLQVDGENFALPTDITVSGADFVQRGAVSVNAVVQRLGTIGTRNLVVILDSCRTSPFPDRQAIGTGLALVDAPENTIIAFSTAPGAVALDGTTGNSPYTAALASALEGPAQDMRDVLKLVRARVRLATGGAQTPWFIDNSSEEIVIRPRRGESEEALLDAIVDRDISLATTAWKTIMASSDPRDFEQFGALFPEDPLAQTAERQLVLIADDGTPDFPLMDLTNRHPDRDIPDGLISQVTACDILATGFGDVTALVDPVPHDLVNTRAATRACVEAVKSQPTNSRLVNNLARVLRIAERFDEALFYYNRAAELGNPSAYAGIASFYRQGIGVEVDYGKALEAARTGALEGSPQLRLMTGIFYREGWGVDQSFTEARRWIRLAMDGGYAPAYVAFGDFYRKGWGVARDEALAIEFYRQASALGSSDAGNLIGMAHMRGKGVERDTDSGIAWLIQASEEGNPYAAFGLGRVFHDGWGAKKDLNQALAYFRLSAQRNYLGAYIRIGDVLRQQENVSEAYANYIIAREAARARATRDSEKQLTVSQEKIAELTPTLSLDQKLEGERIAQAWIDQYGLLDFNLVNE